MKKSIYKENLFVFSSLIIFLSGCADKDVYKGGPNEPLTSDEVFNFCLTEEVELNVDYGFNGNYYVLFEVYDQNPIIEKDDSFVKDESLSPIYAASTDRSGKYSGTITIPSNLTEVWIYSDYPGTVSPAKLTITDNEIDFTQKQYVASLQTQTKGTTTGGYTYTDSWKIMPGVDWDQYGLPSNIESSLNMPSADILYSIRDVYTKTEANRIPNRYPEWLNDNTTSEINIIKDTEVSLVFISSGASFNNSIGYFTYPTGTTPTESSIQKILAFPNASPISKLSNGQRAGALLSGHELKLKYWNETKQQFEDKFPAGVSIGWVLSAMSFKSGNIEKGMSLRYSFSTMNSDSKQHVVALRDASTNRVISIGFEDNIDYDYGDAIFYLNVKEENAISSEGPSLPLVSPPANEENTVTYKGTLTFEDQWPSMGDYDMNDVVMEYKATLYRQVLNNKVYKMVSEFTPIHNGGEYICGFGYQLSNIESDRVGSIQFTGPDGSSVETGQSRSTVVLFDDIKSVLGQKFTVTTTLLDVDENKVTPPYNPFIFANDRGTEIHLVNYPPTSKANLNLFNTEDDASNVSAGVYYISRYDEEVKLMPFGINLPNILDFNIPAERVKIYETYPKFIEWVKSNGSTNKDWYKK